MNTNRGLALLCDEHGDLLQILCDQFGLGDRLTAGMPFPRLAAPGSLAKALSFLVELKTRGAAFGWEINIAVDGQIKTLLFHGGRVHQLLLILGAEDWTNSRKLEEGLMGVNNEQSNTLRATLKEKSSDAAMYNEISRLNNELIAAQRELARANSELEKRVSQRTQELQHAQERLIRQEKLAVLGKMAGSVGHELRNPLGIISNAVYYLQASQPNADPKVKQYLDVIINEVRISEKIIADLLDFARIKSVDRTSVSVSELIQQTLVRFPVPASVEVTLTCPADLPAVHTDLHQTVQVLGNLTVNACQAMNNAGKLILSAGTHGDMMIIKVQDTGVGITSENMKKIFEPLFTTKTKGIGLGLAVSRKLVEANRGRIEVQSEPNKGSTFSLILPIFKEAP
jgi:signal transduction histidine kinase